MDANTILNGLILVLLAGGGYLLSLVKTAAETAVKTSAEKGAEAAIQKLQWPAELARELQKTRGVERQELRFKSYGSLWKELRPLAIYDSTPLNHQSLSDLSMRLSDWYFSDCGGLLMTQHVRDFYFSLQDLLRETLAISTDLKVDRSSEDQKELFRNVLQNSMDAPMSVFTYFEKGDFDDWQKKAVDHGKTWKDGIKKVAAGWTGLTPVQRFAMLQQVGSILRTSLTNDMESRLT